MVFKQVSANKRLICPLCEHKVLSSRLLKAGADLLECSHCDLAFKPFENWPESSSEKAHYDQHQNRIEDQNYLAYLNELFQYVNKSSMGEIRALDYGCGPVKGFEYLCTKVGIKCDSYDPFFFPEEMDLSQKYDVIFLCEVVEHFHQPKKEIEKLISLLKPKGRMLIRTEPLSRSNSNWYYSLDPTHVIFFGLRPFQYIAQTYGLKLEQLSPKIFQLWR